MNTDIWQMPWTAEAFISMQGNPPARLGLDCRYWVILLYFLPNRAQIGAFENSPLAIQTPSTKIPGKLGNVTSHQARWLPKNTSVQPCSPPRNRDPVANAAEWHLQLLQQHGEETTGHLWGHTWHFFLMKYETVGSLDNTKSPLPALLKLKI